ncbi:MAG TPA: helix-turn-helix transcriptional regulator [Thermoanaerobaculia bacterium]|jgi:transcriptional regulator with XRE-family HTH domain|nr:helix-turn-helix transcriptional regulator [Thermoanaerobaculia bacterium]
MKFDDDLDMATLAIAIGERIRAFREEHGLSQRDIAERTGIPREQISHFERGALPSLRNLIILARFMDINEHELLFGTPAEVPISNNFLRKRVLRIERMSYEAQRWLTELLDSFIRKATVDEEDDLLAPRPER